MVSSFILAESILVNPSVEIDSWYFLELRKIGIHQWVLYQQLENVGIQKQISTRSEMRLNDEWSITMKSSFWFSIVVASVILKYEFFFFKEIFKAGLSVMSLFPSSVKFFWLFFFNCPCDNKLQLHFIIKIPEDFTHCIFYCLQSSVKKKKIVLTVSGFLVQNNVLSFCFLSW